MSTPNTSILTQDKRFDILENKMYYLERTMFMSELTMPVRSRLKVILSEYNTARVREGLEPVKVRDLADQVDLSPSVITGLTSGRATRVDFKTLYKLCKHFNCTPGDILVFTPDENS
jgi:putative transcriptional regulator